MVPSPVPPRRPMTPHISSQHCPKNPNIHSVFQSIVKSRKSWKMLKDGEAIWPPGLEAALIEGLENFQPDGSRETLILGRSPMRNKFLSDWIFARTSRRRTTKQIASRLQQFRDTSEGKRLLNLVPTKRAPSCRPDSPESHHSDTALVQNVLCRDVETSSEEMARTVVYIDLLRPDHWSTSLGDNSPLTSWTSPSEETEECLWAKRGYTIVRATQYPRHLHDIDPTITLHSRSLTQTDARSCFKVYSEGRLIFSESTALEPVDPAISNVDGILYKTSLVPGLWDTISQSSDASQYTIIQHVFQDSWPNSDCPIFSAIYKFLYQASSPMEQNFPIPHSTLATDTGVQNINFSLDNDGLLSIKSDVYPNIAAFEKSPNIFDSVDFTLMLDSWSAQCSAVQLVSIPSHYSQPESMLNDIFDVDGLSLPESFLREIDMPNYA